MIGNWLLEHIAAERAEVNQQINQHILLQELKNSNIDIDIIKINKVIDVLELHLFSLLSYRDYDKNEVIKLSTELFKLYKVLPFSVNNIKEIITILKLSCFGIIGEQGVSVSKFL